MLISSYFSLCLGQWKSLKMKRFAMDSFRHRRLVYITTCRVAIGLKISRHILSQSEGTQTDRNFAVSRAFCALLIFALCFDWFIWMWCPVWREMKRHVHARVSHEVMRGGLYNPSNLARALVFCAFSYLSPELGTTFG